MSAAELMNERIRSLDRPDGARIGYGIHRGEAQRPLPNLTLERIAALHWIPTEQPQQMREAIERWCERLRGHF